MEIQPVVVNQWSDLWRKQSWCRLLWLHRRSLLSPQSDSLSTRGKEMSTQLCFCVLKETSFCQFMKLPRKLNERFFPNLHICIAKVLQSFCWISFFFHTLWHYKQSKVIKFASTCCAFGRISFRSFGSVFTSGAYHRAILASPRISQRRSLRSPSKNDCV